MSWLAEFFKSKKVKNITGAIALTFLGSIFGYVLRSCRDFGKIEGDKSVVITTKSLEASFNSGLTAFNNIAIPRKVLLETHSILSEIKQKIHTAEEQTALAKEFEEDKNYNQAAQAYKEAQKSLDSALKKSNELSDPFPEEAKQILIITLEKLSADLEADLAKTIKLKLP